MMITTTLKDIKAHEPCTCGWKKLLTGLDKKRADSKPLPLETILENNGLDDALWALRAVDERYHPAMRLFACYCAKYVLDIFEKEYPEDKRPRQAIDATEKFARGEGSEEDLAAARAAAWAAAWAAARAAADAAAWAAADAAARDAQESRLRKMLNEVA